MFVVYFFLGLLAVVLFISLCFLIPYLVGYVSHILSKVPYLTWLPRSDEDSFDGHLSNGGYIFWCLFLIGIAFTFLTFMGRDIFHGLFGA